MALFKSDRLTSASGSVGGTTYSHNRFGLYLRARRVPVNPNTAAQQSIRGALSAASAAWRALTDAQRTAWDVFAAATSSKNRLGDTVYLSGSQWHSAINSFDAYLGSLQGPFADAPATPGRIDLGSVTVTIDASSASITVNAAGAEGVLVGVFVGDPISAGRRFFKGPYQLVGADQVTTGVASITPAAGRNGLAFVAGQVIPFRIAGQGADGRLTTVREGFATVVA